MSKAVDHAYFTRKMFLHSVLPAPLAAIGLALAEMGDTILVGHAIGMDGLAAIGFVSPLFLLATFFVFGLSMGGAIVYSNLMHEGKKEDALGIFNFFLRLAVLVGVGIAAGGLLWEDHLLLLLGADPENSLVYGMSKSYIFYILLGIPFEILMEVFCSYLRNDDADGLSVSIQTAAGAGNVVLSALLLFVFDWGVAGCSFGFFLSNFFAACVCLGYILLRPDGGLALGRHTASLQEAIKPLRLGFATSAEYIFGAIFTLVSIHLLMNMAGTDGVAVFNVIENLSLLFIFLYEFIGKTSQPLFSTFFAECNFAELHRVFRYALAYSLLLGVLATALATLCPQILDLLFGLDEIEDTAKVYHAARLFCIGTIFMGICLLLQNYLQSEEDESSAFLVVFMRQCGASLPLAFFLAQFGFYAFWLVYPLAEIITLLTLFAYKRRKGERKRIEEARIYAATFLGTSEEVAGQLDAMERFAASWGADSKKRYTLRLLVEEICGFMEEQAHPSRGEHILTQLTLIAREDGTFRLHLRNNGDEIDPFRFPGEAMKDISLPVETEDIRPIVLQVAKKRAHQVLYRSYHGFNTMVFTV